MGDNSGLEKLTDEQLMLAFVQADAAAFDVIYSRYSARVYAYMISRVKERSLAEDLLQETFLKLYRFKERYDPQLPLSGWIFTICRNCFLDFLRKNRKQAGSATDSDISNPVAEQIANENSLSEMTAHLSEPERDILYMRFAEDLKFAEIADSLGLTAANARKIASRALAKLRGLLK